MSVTETAVPSIPDHELLGRVGRGSYGEVWLARGVTGAYRAVKVVQRGSFSSDRPYDREFSGILKFEPVSRTHPGLVSILHVGRNHAAGHFYYVMEVADDVRKGQAIEPAQYLPKTLGEWLKQGPLPLTECIRVGTGVERRPHPPPWRQPGASGYQTLEYHLRRGIAQTRRHRVGDRYR